VADETTFDVGWMQTLNGHREILYENLPPEEALAKKASLQYAGLGAGAVAFIQPHVELPDLDWRAQLDDRQRKEIEFADVYNDDFQHGTDGHNRLLLISKLASMLDVYTAMLKDQAQEGATS
jgi:hypothetical protein